MYTYHKNMWIEKLKENGYTSTINIIYKTWIKLNNYIDLCTIICQPIFFKGVGGGEEYKTDLAW